MRLARLTALTAIGLAFLAAPIAAEAQSAEKIPRIAVVFSVVPLIQLLGSEPSEPHMRAFLQELRTLGYVEGQNIMIERRSAEGRFERFPEIFAELVQAKMDVIVTGTHPATQAAKEATRTIPIVMATSAVDAVTAGLVASFARPGGNITGNSAVEPQLQGKRLALLKEAVPSVSRVAMLLDAKEPRPTQEEVFRTVAAALRLTLLPVTVHEPEQFATAFATFTRQQANGLYVPVTAFTWTHRKLIADLAIRHRLPWMSDTTAMAEAGGLIGYSTDVLGLFRRAAVFVDKILKGAKPADLPVERDAKFDLVINLKTAKALGLTIPPAVLARADEVIQ
jgi:putative ABC transport system substrate-binding protein